MNSEFESVLANKILGMADDELILGHRNSEWCGHAPILEEDIAFANIALDELGHAILWYQLYARLVGKDPNTYPDHLVYFREAFEYRNTHFVVLPKGDWAFSMLRQYMYDLLEDVQLALFAESAFKSLAETAEKIRREEIYHLRHTSAWVKRLGLGTEESNTRMQNALTQLWPYVGQLFYPITGEMDLVEKGIIPDPEKIRQIWEENLISFLESACLHIPERKFLSLSRDLQSQHLIDVLAELQQVARTEPEAQW